MIQRNNMRDKKMEWSVYEVQTFGVQQQVCLVAVFSLTSHNKTHFGQEHSDSVSASSPVNTEDSNTFKDI